MNNPKFAHPIHINHLSGTSYVGPCGVAGGFDLLLKREKGMNELTYNYLLENLQPGDRTGVIIMDFPGCELINTVLSANAFLTAVESKY